MLSVEIYSSLGSEKLKQIYFIKNGVAKTPPSCIFIHAIFELLQIKALTFLGAKAPLEPAHVSQEDSHSKVSNIGANNM
jgi:hypothetical protein